MKTGYGFAILIVAGASLFSATPTFANAQSTKDIRATSSIPDVAMQRGPGQLQLAQGTGSRTGRGCPKNYRWDYRSQQCVKL